MAPTVTVEPVVRICAVISRYAEVRQAAIGTLVQNWGEVAFQTEPQSFEAGGFYTAEMGTDLKKVIVAFADIQDPAPLASWKLDTNRWESPGDNWGVSGNESRPLNLDPGYVTQAKLVLATTKDRDHRVYLRDGIFGEVTLTYTGKRWTDHRWTYPDYRTDEVKAFVQQCRDYLRSHLRQNKQFRSRGGDR